MPEKDLQRNLIAILIHTKRDYDEKMFTNYITFLFPVMSFLKELYNNSSKHIKSFSVCTHMWPLTELFAQTHEHKHQTCQFFLKLKGHIKY